MLYAGVDYDNRYSQVHVIHQNGRTRAAARLANDSMTVGKFFDALRELQPVRLHSSLSDAQGSVRNFVCEQLVETGCLTQQSPTATA